MSSLYDTLVIGAGQAGLAAGYHLQRAGLRFAILEAGAGPHGSWPHYYQSLTLFSPARYSSLPGRPFPGDPAHSPTRAEVVAYLAGYAAHFGLPIVPQTPITQVARQDGGFVVTAADGRTYQARTVVAVSGAFSRPYLPAFPGQAQFRGQLLHAASYQAPTPFAGQRVVVVGAGNSAVQIAVELATVADVTLATRHPVRFRPQQPLGRDIHFWMHWLGFDSLPLGRWFDLPAPTGVLDTGRYQAALAAGRPNHRPLFRALAEDGVEWADGTRERVDAVLCATGYRPNLDYLAGLGALDATGQAQQHGGISRAVPGLYYVGLSGQRTFASATLRGGGPDAAVVVAHLRRRLRAPMLAHPVVHKLPAP
ncbi:MAG TPA: NAD(P)-binding domain-containing protein [Chloroflexia bacterium]|nr:NAD(P)-binding domain-containing protein [Chloroflexia bacterium]